VALLGQFMFGHIRIHSLHPIVINSFRTSCVSVDIDNGNTIQFGIPAVLLKPRSSAVIDCRMYSGVGGAVRWFPVMVPG